MKLQRLTVLMYIRFCLRYTCHCHSVRGSGIGLALVDSIMTALDGTMDIQSTLGRGTVVTLGLPLYHKA